MKEANLEQYKPQIKEEKISKLKLEEKSSLELKNLMKRKKIEEVIKLTQTETQQIQMNIDKNDLAENKFILRKVYNKIKLLKPCNNNIRNIKVNTYIIEIIFISLLISINNIIEYNSFEIKLKLQRIGYSNILSSFFNKRYYPDIIYINGIQNDTIQNKYYFNKAINNATLIWNKTINSCYHMFNGCSNIIEIDFSNFDTSDVTDMGFMFCGCNNLSSLNLSNFKTSNVRSMLNMFRACNNLYSLNLSNFKTSNVRSMNGMFCGCSSLFYLDLSHFVTSKVTDMNSMFTRCSNLFSLNLSNFDTSNVQIMRYMFSYCSKLYSIDLSSFNTLKVKDMFNMFNYCSQLGNINILSFEENSSLNTSNIFNNLPDNVIISLNKDNKNIFHELTKQYYCLGEHLVLNKIKCIKNIYSIKDFIENITVKNEKLNEEEEIKYYDNILKIIEDILTSNNFNTSNLDNGNNEIIELEKIKITFTTTQNQKININDNSTSVDFGECENSLRQTYNLTNGEIIYLKIIEKNKKGCKYQK